MHIKMRVLDMVRPGHTRSTIPLIFGAATTDLVRAMGGAPDLQTAQHPSSSDSIDCDGSLLELQEDTLFDIAEDAPAAEGRMHKASSHASIARSSKSR